MLYAKKIEKRLLKIYTYAVVRLARLAKMSPIDRDRELRLKFLEASILHYELEGTDAANELYITRTTQTRGSDSSKLLTYN